jgi:uncharacterized membrane protein YcaP (DUF421 family)
VEWLWDVDWLTMLVPSVSPIEIALRGSAVYLALFIVLRLVLRRELGRMNVADLLLIVLIADAAHNAMSAEYKSITDGFVLVGTILGWNYLLDWLAYRYPFFARFVHPPKVELVREGRIIRRSLAKEKITQGELMSAIRMHGIEGVDEVRHAYMEPDGTISVIPFSKPDVQATARDRQEPL